MSHSQAFVSLVHRVTQKCISLGNVEWEGYYLSERTTKLAIIIQFQLC